MRAIDVHVHLSTADYTYERRFGVVEKVLYKNAQRVLGIGL